MPMQVGEMMVIVRAQDFASRTLRRVSGELSGMSRTQRMAAMQQAVAFQKISAMQKVATAESNARRLKYVRDGVAMRNSLVMQTQALERLATAQAAVMKKGRFKSGITREQIREWQNASAVVRQLGLEGVLTARRLSQIRTDIAARGRKGPTPTQARELSNAQRAASAMSPASADRVRQFYRLNQAVEAFGQRLSGLPSRLQQAASSQRALGDAMHRSNIELNNAYSSLSRAQKAQLAFNNALKQMPAQRLADVGHAISGIGRTMQLVGLIGAGVLAGASNSFANFNQQVMLAATQTRQLDQGWNTTVENAGKLQTAIRDLMQEFPAHEDEMSQAAYDIYSSMTISFDGGIDLLKKFNQVSVATMTDLVTTTNAGITVLNNFGGSSKDIDKTLNLMVATVRYGRMTLSDFNDMLNKVAPAAASAGLSLEDVAGAMALITTRQPSQRQGATQIARLLQVFMDPEFQQGVRNASHGMIDIVKAGGGLKPLPQVVSMLSRGFKQLSSQKGAEQFFKQMTAVGRGSGRGRADRIEAQRGWIFLSKNLEDYLDLQHKVTTNTDEFAQALKAMSESPGVRWQVMINQFRVLILLIGEKAIPVFLQIGDAIGDAIQWFNRLNDHMKGNAIRWAAIASVAILVSGVILGIAGPIIALVAHFKMWRLAAATTEAKVISLAGVMKLLPLIGLGLLLKQFVGLQRAIEIMTLGMIAWKITSIAATVAVAAANTAAATTFTLVWRRALASTGIGIFAIAAGLAAEYVITHWEQVKVWFADFWDWLRITSYQAALDLVEPFTHIPNIPGFGNMFQDAKESLLKSVGELNVSSHLRKEMQGNEQALDAWLKKSPKKIAAYRKSLQGQLLTGDFRAGTNKAMVIKELKDIADAYARAWQKKKQLNAGKGGALSEEFWNTPGGSWKDFSSQLDDFYKKQLKGADDTARSQSELAQTIKNAAENTVSSMKTMYQSLEQVNRDAFGELFQGPWLSSPTFDLAREWGIKPRIEDMIKDLGMQRARFAKWRSSIDGLMKKGIPRGLIDEISKMGPEAGQSFFDELMKAKPGQVQKLINQWKGREKDIQSQTKMDFTDEIGRFRKAGVDMGDAIVNGFESAKVGLWFDGWIKTTFPTVISAAVNTAVKDWKNMNPGAIPPTPAGAGVGAGISGFTRGNPGVWGVGHGPATNNTDNSKTVTITIKHPEEGTRGRHTNDHDKRLAWTIANAIRTHS